MSGDALPASASGTNITALSLTSSLLRRSRSANEISATDSSDTAIFHIQRSVIEVGRSSAALQRRAISFTRTSTSSASQGDGPLQAHLELHGVSARLPSRSTMAQDTAVFGSAEPLAKTSPVGTAATLTAPPPSMTDTSTASTSQTSSSAVGSYHISSNLAALVRAAATREDQDALFLGFPAELRGVGDRQSLQSVSHNHCGQPATTTMSNGVTSVYPTALLSVHAAPSSKTGPLSTTTSGGHRLYPQLPINFMSAAEALMVDPDAPRPHRGDLRHQSRLRSREGTRAVLSSAGNATPDISPFTEGDAPTTTSAPAMAGMTVVPPCSTSPRPTECGMVSLLTSRTSLGGAEVGGGSVPLLKNSNIVPRSSCSKGTRSHTGAATTMGISYVAQESQSPLSPLTLVGPTRGGAQRIELPLCAQGSTAYNQNPLEQCISGASHRPSPPPLFHPSPLSPQEQVEQTSSFLSTQSSSGPADAPYHFVGLLDGATGSSFLEEDDCNSLRDASRGGDTSGDTLFKIDSHEKPGGSEGGR